MKKHFASIARKLSTARQFGSLSIRLIMQGRRTRWRMFNDLVQITCSGLFDRKYYLHCNPVVQQTGEEPLIHYLTEGSRQGQRPCPLFNPGFYRNRYPDAASSGIDPLTHFIRFGAKQALQPCLLFDTAYYLGRYKDVRQSGLNPLAHFIAHGASEGRQPHPLFDTQYYLDEYFSDTAQPPNPLVDFLERGGVTARNPNPLFDSDYYLARRPHLKKGKVNPLLHYLREGAPKVQKTHPLFDPNYYLETYFRDEACPPDPLLDFLERGGVAACNPNPLFDSAFYYARHPQLKEHGEIPLVHYIQEGARLGYRPHPLFDSQFYERSYLADTQRTINPLADYLESGAEMGRKPNPLFDSAFYLSGHRRLREKSINPLAYFIHSGWRKDTAINTERFLLDEVRKIASGISREDSGKAVETPTTIPLDTRSPARGINIYTSSCGNLFFSDIQTLLVRGFGAAGFDVNACDEYSSREYDPSRLHFFLAPHEFFFLGGGENWVNLPVLNHAIMLNSEQPHTKYFSKSLPFLYRAEHVFDINPLNAAVLRKWGINAQFLPLGFVDGLADLTDDQLPDQLISPLAAGVTHRPQGPEDELRQRPIDIYSISANCSRREDFFSRNALFLSQFENFIYLPTANAPLIKGDPRGIDLRQACSVSRRSKILLNIHRSDLNYFEWHRVVLLGMAQRTLVVSEPCYDVPGFEPDIHYISCELDAFPATIKWLLTDPVGQKKAEEISLNGYRQFRKLYRARDILASVFSETLQRRPEKQGHQ